MTPAQPPLAPALSAARHAAEDSAPPASHPEPAPQRRTLRARLAALSPEARANILVLVPALLSLGHSCGSLLPREKRAALRARRRQVGWALLSSAHAVSTLRMALVVREWVQEAQHNHPAHRDEDHDAPLAHRAGEFLSWGAEVLEVAALVAAFAAIAVRLRGMKKLHHTLGHCGETMEHGSLWLAASSVPLAWMSTGEGKWDRVALAGDTVAVVVELFGLPPRLVPARWRARESAKNAVVAALAAASAGVRLLAL